MYEFIHTYSNGEEIKVKINNEDLTIYQVGTMFYKFLLAVGFAEGSIRELFALEEGEELPLV